MSYHFDGHFTKPHDSAAVNAKLLLLCKGISVDVGSLARDFGTLEGIYKTSKSVVSDRHHGTKQVPKEFLVDELILSDDRISTIVKTYISEDAPFLLVSDAKTLRLKDRRDGSCLPVTVSFVTLDEFSRPDATFAEKHLFLNRIGIDRIGLLPFEGCELWLQKQQCHFCGSVPKRRGVSGLPNILEARQKFGGDYRAWWGSHRERVHENVKMGFHILRRCPPKPHIHFMYMSENVQDYDFAYEIAHGISEAINDVWPLQEMDSFFNAMPPARLDLLEMVKKVGFRSYVVNLEFIRREDFMQFCPGKHGAYADGYNHMMAALEAAVGLFGVGNVRSNFVVTSEQIPHLKAGIDDLARTGVVADMTVFFPRKASLWRDKQPPTADEILEFSRFLASNYRQYGFKPYCCSLSSRSSVLNELLACS